MNKLSEAISNAKRIFEADGDSGEGLNIKEAEKNISAYVSKLIGVNIQCKITPVSGKPNEYRMTSNDLSVGMKPKMFKKLEVESFGNIAHTKDGYYWLNCYYAYMHFNSGTNGTPISTMWLLPDGTIKQANDIIK